MALAVVAAGLYGFNACVLVKGEGNTPRLLVFSKTKGFRHASIKEGKLALMKLGLEKGWKVDTTENADYFCQDSLERYHAVVFLSTTGDVLNRSQEAAFERYIQAGGGFVGIHAATDTEYGWVWYNQLVGGQFDSHPEIQQAKINVSEAGHISTSHLPKPWTRTDEWYNFKPETFNKTVKVLLKLDESSYKGGKMGAEHPIAWYHDYDGGRAWYTGLGHTAESYTEEAFLKHLTGGLEYAMRQKALDWSQAHTQIPPDDSRFTRSVLATGLNEPVELTVAKDGRVFFVERKGAVKLWDPNTKQTQQIAQINVDTKFEDGLLGITLDPAFGDNGWLYLYYSPNERDTLNRLSRFTFRAGALGDEKMMMQIPTQRRECCHTGGSLAFDAEGNLWITTGDNTNPFKSFGYAPNDERPGRQDFDAQRSSANTQDLRGKILRITPQPDGSYTIPKGNLFADAQVGRPEIYVMGCRQPYRISIDNKNKRIFWGEIGPDAGKDSVQGPRGHDEFNMAASPGFYGWPLFIGNNKPYSPVDFNTFAVGQRFDPKRPVNNSPNNTGAKVLPPARPALVWYPYAYSEEFPWLEKGGRSAMAGPVYNYQMNNPSRVKLPAYYDGSVIFYEWMRNLFFALWIDEKGTITKREQLFSSIPLNRVIDMELGPDGALYMLEYGNIWFGADSEVRLTKVEYTEDNRIPVAQAKADVTVGGLPLTVNFSSEGTFDYDKADQLEYEWRITDPFVINSKEKNPTFTFTQPGKYPVILVVTDPQGQSATASVVVQVGNAPPKVDNWLEEGNQTFFWPNTQVRYASRASDKEDGSTADGGIPLSELITTAELVEQGQDLTMVAQGHQENKAKALSPGEAAMAQSDCKACHQPEIKSIGPSWKMVSDRYRTQAGSKAMLVKKVIAGGGGNWGDHAMSAHPQLSPETVGKMVDFILAYGAPAKPKNALPSQGIARIPSVPASMLEQSRFVITTSYSDRGGNGQASATSERQIVLRSPYLQMEDKPRLKFDAKIRAPGWASYVEFKSPKAYVIFDSLDLSGVTALLPRYASEQPKNVAVEFHLDSLNGPLWASTSLKPTGKWDGFERGSLVPVKPVKGRRSVYVKVILPDAEWDKLKNLLNVDWLYLHNGRGPVLIAGK